MRLLAHANHISASYAGPECTPAPYSTSFLCSVYEFEGHAYSSKATWVNAGHSTLKSTKLFAGVVTSLVAMLLLHEQR